jgi:hypothetical protein
MIAIFLDIDGVVATERSLWEEYCNYFGVEFTNAAEDVPQYTKELEVCRKTAGLPYPMISVSYWPFDSVAIKNLYKLQRETKCVFVMSSTWRKGRSIDEINDLMAYKGLRLRFTGKTDTNMLGIRGKEIETYLLLHPEITNFLIIDDSDDMLMHQRGNFVKTDYWHGFDDEKLAEALAILQKQG